MNKYILRPDYPGMTITGFTHTPVACLQFGSIKIDCATGEVTGLSENISEDAKVFWKQVKENIIGK